MQRQRNFFQSLPHFCRLMQQVVPHRCVQSWWGTGALHAVFWIKGSQTVLIKSDRCVCFQSWLRCSAEPLSLYFMEILPKSIKGSVFYTLTPSLIKLALIILADVWNLAKKIWTILGCMWWTLRSSSPSLERISLKVRILSTCSLGL